MKNQHLDTEDAPARPDHASTHQNSTHAEQREQSLPAHQTSPISDPYRRIGYKPYFPIDHAFIQETKDWIWHKAHALGHKPGVFLYDEAREKTYNFCHCCGRRIVIDTEKQSCEGELLTLRCDNDALRARETRAWLIGEIDQLLEDVLREQVERLGPTMAARFLGGEMQIEHKRVVSMDGFFAISWRIREWPHLPISEINPQAMVGLFEFTKVVEEDNLRRGRYIGPRINPNGHEDEATWKVYPLETGETGFIYRDDLGCWRFKRENGVVGYYPRRDTLLYEDGTPVLPMQKPMPDEIAANEEEQCAPDVTSATSDSSSSSTSSEVSVSEASLDLFDTPQGADSLGPSFLGRDVKPYLFYP